MTNHDLYSARLLRPLCASLVAFAFYFPGAACAAGSDGTVAAMACEPKFSPLAKYDQGAQTSLAAHPSGLVLEFHQTEGLFDSSLWYRLGTLVVPSVKWGGSQHSGTSGYDPAVAISREGYVLVVHSNKSYKSGSDLYYQVGKVDPYGGHNQSITWLTGIMHWDAGFNGSIAMNDSGVIVGVHEAGRGGDGLYYRVGHLRNPAGGDYTVQWDGVAWGIRYDTGINPNIAINNNEEVVEVHQVPGESLLHYRRGFVYGATIYFGESRRYDDDATQPAVAVLDSGLVLEVDITGSGGDVKSRTGKLSLAQTDEIEWSAPVNLEAGTSMVSPALATTDTRAIVTSRTSMLPFSLFASVAELCDP